jgi:hypothetical protein
MGARRAFLALDPSNSELPSLCLLTQRPTARDSPPQAMLAAKREMDIGLGGGTSTALRKKMERRCRERLQESYRNVWNQSWCAQALSHSSHLMIWSDNDVTNDFTVAVNADGSQEHAPAYLRVAMNVYRSYQRQLREPGCAAVEACEVEGGGPSARLREHFCQVYGGWCGCFFIDMRGNLVDASGVIHPESPRLSDEQKRALTESFGLAGLRCMVLSAEIPFVGPSPQQARDGAAKLPFLKEHWAYNLDELLWVLDLAFGWKAAEPGREVVMLAGDIHVGVDSTITDAKTGLSIRHVTTSPITNSVSRFFNDLEGRLSERYTYSHKVLDELHNFCALDLAVGDDDAVHADVELIGIPVPPR